MVVVALEIGKKDIMHRGKRERAELEIATAKRMENKKGRVV